MSTETAIVPAFDVEVTVLSQYANSPVISTLIEAFSQWFDPTANLEAFYSMVWDIDSAEGFGLDIWGRILGIARVIPIPGTSGAFGFDTSDTPPDWEDFGNINQSGAGGPFFAGAFSGGSYRLQDGAYRTLLLTKALANICTTTAPALNALVQNLFPDQGVCYVLDNGGMSMTYVFEFELSTIDYAILAYSGVLPHPAGVLTNIAVISTGYFGFAEAGDLAEPWNEGLFYNGGS